ncbi:MAG: hypothetical protein GSR80_001221 [Desulfurococcales archaeon]|nr:hypothetical protein [Desulfurococcales archaeon]
MYSSGSISKVTITELLSDMAREIEYTASVVERALREKGFRGEVLDKLARQDVKMLKDKAERYRNRLLEYVANGRAEIVGLREFYTAIALSIENSALKMDASIFRLLLYISSSTSTPARIEERYLALLGKLRDTAGYLTSLIRAISLGGHTREARRRIQELATKISQVEEDADVEYRRALAAIVEELGGDVKGFVLVKEAVDHLEDAVDLLYNAGNYATIIALSEA